MKIVQLTKTCDMHPSQWDARLEDGRVVHIRYKWRQLSVHIGPSTATIMDVVGIPPWFDAEVGEKHGSYMEIGEVCARTGLELGSDVKPFVGP